MKWWNMGASLNGVSLWKKSSIFDNINALDWEAKNLNFGIFMQTSIIYGQPLRKTEYH
jgi:hypothetical protein